jgi:hypothetical protein
MLVLRLFLYRTQKLILEQRNILFLYLYTKWVIAYHRIAQHITNNYA